MRKLAAAILLLTTALQASAQRGLTLGQAIEIARNNSNEAEISENSYMKGLAEFEHFESTFKPHLELNVNPNYVREAYEFKENFAHVRDYDRLSAMTELSFSQKVTPLGGDFYAASSGVWTEHFSDNETFPRLFGANPVRIGYQQQLLGYNPYKWERQVENARVKNVRSRHSREYWDIAGSTAGLYLDALRAREMYKMYLNNAETAEMLYRIGEQKYSIASIRNDELSSLKLQWMNSRNNCRLTETEMASAFNSLTSYLGLEEGEMPELSIPEMPSRIILDRQMIYDLVEENNPAYNKTELDILSARSREEKARRETGLQASMDVNIGLQNYAPEIRGAFGNQSFFSVSGIGLRIPIIDQKTARSKYKAAQFETRAVEAESREELRKLRVEVDAAIRDFENYQELIQEAESAMRLADEAYSQANDNYANGIADINTFAIAQDRKEKAWTNYLNILCRYWKAYYRLSSLCGSEIN